MEEIIISEEKRKEIIDTVENLFSFCTKEEELRESLDRLEDTIRQKTQHIT